jgi:hypothetical protein
MPHRFDRTISDELQAVHSRRLMKPRHRLAFDCFIADLDLHRKNQNDSKHQTLYHKKEIRHHASCVCY